MSSVLHKFGKFQIQNHAFFANNDYLSLICAVFEYFRHMQRFSYNTVLISRLYQPPNTVERTFDISPWTSVVFNCAQVTALPAWWTK